jgi:hypothetical protein
MKRHALALAVLALFCSGFAAAEGAPGQKEKAGYALLDMYIRSFQEMATHGTGGVEVVDEDLGKMAGEARKAREEGGIDLVFHTRFTRILALTKLFVRPDPENILKPVIDRELADFLKDVTGEDVMRSGGPAVLGQVANALAEEIVDLQIYLDTKGTREALRKKLDARITGAEKKD